MKEDSIAPRVIDRLGGRAFTLAESQQGAITIRFPLPDAWQAPGFDLDTWAKAMQTVVRQAVDVPGRITCSRLDRRRALLELVFVPDRADAPAVLD